MVVVTGANGFIGSALVWELNQAGITDIICVDFVPPEERTGPLQQLKFKQFIDADAFLTAMNHNELPQVDVIFHMGASSSTTMMDREYLQRVNINYSKSVFDYCLRQNALFIHASSASVYGDGALGFSDETLTSHFKPMNPYGESKHQFDVWLEQQKDQPKHWYSLRFFNVYGPNEYHKGSQASVVYHAYQQIRDTGRLKLFKSHRPDFEDGKQKRDFVYVKELTHWMLELYKKSSNTPVKSGIYNMGYGLARTWIDLAEQVFATLGKPTQIDFIDIPDNLRSHYQYFTEANMEKLKKSNLSLPAWPIEKGIKDYVGNYLNNTDNPYLR